MKTQTGFNGYCKGCKNLANDNSKMKTPGVPAQAGNYCLKFKWNLGRVKTWTQKQSAQKGVTLPGMTSIPGDCYD
ncbi:MAG: hypothetical protein KAI81_04375 [Candidatus Marinimicrobia bacterium]|nr:hypothetical protein [Candidatus Neomarinimicrobiota bacterium]